MTKQDTRIVKVAGRNRRPWALASKDRLVEAATKEIAAVGFERARLSEIAERADMTPGSVYTWFENKEDLFRAALEDALTAQLVNNTEALKDTELVEHWFPLQVSTLVPRNHKDSGPTDAQKLLIEAYYASWRDPKARKRLAKGINSHIEMYTNVMKNGQAHGKISPDIDAEAIALIMLAMHTGMSFINLAGGPRVRHESWNNILVRLFNAMK
jgi:AcrR family transcriptional regulator